MEAYEVDEEVDNKDLSYSLNALIKENVLNSRGTTFKFLSKLTTDNKIGPDPSETIESIRKGSISDAIKQTESYISQKKVDNRIPDDSIHYYFVKALASNFKRIQFEYVTKLLKQGVDINYKNKYGDTILFEAVKCWDQDVVEFLIENKADVNVINSYGRTILHVAATFDKSEILTYLVDKAGAGKYLDTATNNELQTPLHFAAKNGSIKVIYVLLGTEFQLSVDRECKDYLGRTPLYLAAEYGRKSAVKQLIDLNCSVEVSNVHGQTTMFWIITKCPEIAVEALNQFQMSDTYTRVDYYYLTSLEPSKTETGEISKAKSVLAALADSKNFEVIIHPTMLCLIKYKWKQFGRFYAILDLLFTLLNIIVWLLLGTLVPFNERYHYKLPDDGWRIFLFVMGIIFTMVLLAIEIYELISTHIYLKKILNQRNEELDSDKRFCHPREEDKIAFIMEEKRLLRKDNIFVTYITDPWNIYDLLSICLLLSCIFTHVADIINHSEYLARVHIRIMSITVVFISVRLLKVGRVINERFGILVMTLYHVIYDIATWLFVYIIFWIPYTCAFWMIFGGTRFLESVDENVCTSISSTNPDCITVQADSMDTFNNVIFQLYRTTLGDNYDRENMNKIDPIMTSILNGSYIGITILLLINIFIAMLSSTFQRLYDNSKANMLLQRAILIMNIEHSMSDKIRNKFYKRFLEQCNPYKDKKYNEKLRTLDAGSDDSEIKKKLAKMEIELKSIHECLYSMGATDSIYSTTKTKILTEKSFQHKLNSFEKKTNQKIEMLDSKIESLCDLLQIYLKNNQNQNVSTANKKKGNHQIDLLHLTDFVTPVNITVDESSS